MCNLAAPPSTPAPSFAREAPPLVAMPAALLAAARALGAGEATAAARMLDDVPADPRGDVAARLAGYFAAALRARAGAATLDDGNLYGGAVGPEAMLAAFRVLTERTPLVAFGHGTVAAAVASLARGGEALHVVDLGAGHGAQWDGLLRALAGGAARPALRLTAVDLPAPGDDPAAALRCTGERLAALAARHDVALEFEARPEPIESMAPPALREGETLVVNAALALHHLPDGARDRTLAAIAAWRPARLFLVEPDADHDELPFEARFAEAWRHYGLVFEALDATLDRGLPARAVIEGAFFGREIANVVGCEGDRRFERHERIARWRDRVTRAGFTPVSLDAFAPAVERPFRARPVDGATVLCLGARPLVAASAWRL